MTLHRDLESLLSEVDAGWSSPSFTHGTGGCLLDGMYRVIGIREDGGRPVTGEDDDRVDAMIVALGFTRPSERGPHSRAMFEWNDEQSDPKVIKLRVKDALNKA